LIFRSPEAAFGAGAAAAAPAARTGVSSIPQIGQVPGSSWNTFGCIPQL
jgi:hypothetical protein